MRMRILDRRVQLLLDEPRHAKLVLEAKRRNVSVATVIRDAIDRMPGGDDRSAQAIDAILAAEPMAVPADVQKLRAETDRGRVNPA
jgi:hypothetical protein